MELRHVSVHGHRLAYRTQGSGPVLVLLHGMAGSSSAWNEVGAALGARFTVVAPDLLGHGESAKPRGEYSISGHANVLRDLLAALGHRRASIVGHSFGGGVAMQFAYQYPSQCERLVLVSSGGLGPEVGWLLRALSAPGVDQVFPFVCSPALRSAGERMLAAEAWGYRPLFVRIVDRHLLLEEIAEGERHTRDQLPEQERLRRADHRHEAAPQLLAGAVESTAGADRMLPFFGRLSVASSTPAVRITITRESGRKTFQPRRMSWS